MSAVYRGVRVGSTGLRVKQYGADDGLKIAPHAQSVVHEDTGDTADVSRAGIARDQVLDELTTYKGRQVGVLENVIQGRV